VNHLGVDGLGDDVPVVGDVLHHLADGRPLHLLPFQVAQRVREEIEEDAALPQLLDEELLLLRGGDVCGTHRGQGGHISAISWGEDFGFNGRKLGKDSFRMLTPDLRNGRGQKSPHEGIQN